MSIFVLAINVCFTPNKDNVMLLCYLWLLFESHKQLHVLFSYY